MRTKRIGRWVIVVFLLAALPGMTAVLAQGQEPGPLTPYPTCNVSESEWNDAPTVADVIEVNDVVCGNNAGSVITADFFRFHMPEDGIVLIQLWYSEIPAADVSISLYDSDERMLHTVSSLDYGDIVPSVLMFYSLRAGDYYIGLWPPKPDWKSVNYSLTLSSPILISAAPTNLSGGGNVGGIKFYSGDILAHADLNNGDRHWWKFFEAEDLGLIRNITNIAAGGGDTLLLSLGASQTLPDVGLVTPHDIIIYDPLTVGAYTKGTFRMGMRGAEHGLTTAGEKLDAIDGWVNGNDSCYGFPVSTTGIANVPSWNTHIVKQDDEDVFCKVYDGTWQPWRYFFDVKGKNNAPKWWVTAPHPVIGLPREDVIALAYNDTRDQLFMTIQGVGTILGQGVTQKDIFAINYPDYTWGGIVWHGPEHGWGYNIDAFEYNGW